MLEQWRSFLGGAFRAEMKLEAKAPEAQDVTSLPSLMPVCDSGQNKGVDCRGIEYHLLR